MFCTKYLLTPIGFLTVTANHNAITKIAFGKVASDNMCETKLLNEAARQIELYFAGKLKDFDLPLEFAGTVFQTAAWEALRKIPYGVTASYSDQAKTLGRPKAIRAVGGANNKNPIAVVVPCHRVVGKNGSLTGFGGGLDVKSFLLQLEAKYA